MLDITSDSNLAAGDVTGIDCVTSGSQPALTADGLPSGSIRTRLLAPASWMPANRASAFLSAVIAMLAIIWVVVIFTVAPARFVVLAPAAKAGVEVILALTSLFGALVLFLFPDEGARQRLRWVGCGFLVLGVGGLVFGYLQSLFDDSRDLNASIYTAVVVRGLAGGLIAFGLLPRVPRRFTLKSMLVIMVLFVALSAAVYAIDSRLPVLVHADSLELISVQDPAMFSGLTYRYWILSSIPLGLACAAACGAVWRFPGQSLGGWLAIAMTLMAGSQLHALFWPSAFSPLLTTASLLRLGFTVAVVAGGTLELRAIARERAAQLLREQEYSRRLGELARLRADFTAMVAHELTTPLAAIRRYTDVLALGDLSAREARAIDAIQSEMNVLNALIADVHTIATAERDDFAIHPQPVSITVLLTEAAGFVRMLPGDHPVTISVSDDVRVMADPERIGQVLRNLLSNAAKYSPRGASIELRSMVVDGSVRVEVIDQGYGIHPEDLKRIFEKFQRGRDTQGGGVPGIGVGLYLSRRIVQAHGAELSVESTYGLGSTFSFSLRVV